MEEPVGERGTKYSKKEDDSEYLSPIKWSMPPTVMMNVERTLQLATIL